MSVPDECYSRNASCALNLISTFLLQIIQTYKHKNKLSFTTQCLLCSYIMYWDAYATRETILCLIILLFHLLRESAYKTVDKAQFVDIIQENN